MDLWSAALLGLVQALTEFLPVSSSGHLVLGQALLGVTPTGGAAFEVAVHFGTLLSVLLLFRAEVIELTGALLRALRAPGQIGARWGQDPALRLLGAIAVGCLPAGVIGVLFKDELEAAFGSVTLVGGALIFTGLVLLSTRLAPDGDGAVTLKRGVLIGWAQALAILPGISRSGSTIAAGLFLGVERDSAARYSFLLSLPVVAGATLLKAKDLAEAPPASDLMVALGVGAGVSFVAGLGALWLVMAVVRRGWFRHFGWYCLAAGITTLIAA
ncbi:MAG: undecaprenyl-diphosphate phosphatase [Myxococcales bacterium]|nr:undecaprenyl-diphosphate phosphatase [Myxococcales bacterium]